MEYFIIDNNGQQAGPFSLDQLVQKGITPETLVWKQGMKDWTPAWKVDDMKAVLEAVEADKMNQQQPPRFQQEAAMEKKSSHFAIKAIIGLLIFLLAIFAVSNPSADSHKEKVRTEVGKAIEKATATSDNNFFTQALRSAAKMMADNMMSEAMDQLFEYHNYIVCSKGSVEFNGKQHTISFGILGKVYTMNADDMVKALEGADNLQFEETESTSSSDGNQGLDNSSSSDDNLEDNPNLDEENNADNGSSSVDGSSDDSNDGGISARVQKKLEDKASKAFDKAADKVSKKVEEKINQKLNEATDSSKIEQIINKILDLI